MLVRLLAFYLMRARDGSVSSNFQGHAAVSRGQTNDRNVPLWLTFPSAVMRCGTNDPSRLYLVRRRSVTMAASRTYPNSHWLPHYTIMDSCSSTLAPPTPWRPDPRMRNGPGWGCWIQRRASTAMAILIVLNDHRDTRTTLTLLVSWTKVKKKNIFKKSH